jgi:HEAT repeats
MAALLAAAIAACHRAPSGAVRIGSIAVSDANVSGNPELGLQADQVRKLTVRALEDTRRFAVREGASARIRLEIESARRVTAPSLNGPDRELADVELSMELTAPNAQGDWERAVSEGSGRAATGAESGPDPEARLSAFGTALRFALDDASRGIAWQLDARKKTDDDLVADLSSLDPRVRDYAIRALADRRSPAAVPHLLARLQDDDPTIVLRAVGALVAIGDRRAVEPLIDLTRKRPPHVATQVLYALASLGGPTAEAYLFTLESGATDEDIRRAASDALAELRRKRDDASARAPGRNGAHP